ncbi:MAG TPA: efflux RND transporter periplasmic adaptor subunit [Saprospiraceae bacterium]|nr:efflux RND transporter periplasmic adaptor subunit [Saprospiraceae bacterium]
MKTNILFTITIAFWLIACKKTKNDFDASGAFEAEEVIISSEATGIIKQFDLQEGQELKAGQFIGYIDSTQLFLKKKQLLAQIQALLSKKPDVSAQLATLQEQLKTAEKEQKRISELVKADAATPKQLDDINAQINILKKQIAAQQSSLGITTSGISKEALPFQIQIEQINDQLLKSKIMNPIPGTVITKYAEANEMAVQGKPLYKIADLSSLIFRAYITANQLPQITLNQKVNVLTDDGQGQYKETEGIITWISDKAEFTPKTIQTKEERANMVYAIKVKVQNDGFLKIGMYGELKFAP